MLPLAASSILNPRERRQSRASAHSQHGEVDPEGRGGVEGWEWGQEVAVGLWGRCGICGGKGREVGRGRVWEWMLG